MMNVMVMGALGKMGREVCKAVVKDPDLSLFGAVDTASVGKGTVLAVEGKDVVVSQNLDDLGTEHKPDVMVDFTRRDAAIKNIMWALENDVHCVVGTTGIGEEDIAGIENIVKSGDVNVLIAPNFALGAVLMMRFSEMAAGVFDQCEIIELHHRGKLDAPSGTALSTADRINKVISANDLPRAQENDDTGFRGGSIGPVQIHSVRLDGLVAHQEVIFGSQGQTLTIRHDTTDRSCFMPGVVMSIKAVSKLPGLTIGLESVLKL